MYLLGMNPILIAAAVIPAIILLVKVYKADRLEKEPAGFLVSLVFFGIISTVIAGAFERVGIMVLDIYLSEGSVIYNIILYYIIVAVSEECAKYAVLRRRTWKSPHFNCRFDAIVYSVFVSLGFALWENISYVFSYGLSTALVRAVTAVPGHASFGVFMGVWYGSAKYCANLGRKSDVKKNVFKALAVPVLLHGTYDLLASEGWYGVFFTPFVIIMFLAARRAVRSMSAADINISGEEPAEGFFSGNGNNQDF